MATRTVKARVELDGEKQYKQALSELNQGNKVLASEMRKLQAEYKGNAESTEFLTKKGDLLQRQLQQQQDKVSKLREALQASAEKYGEADKRTQDWIVKLNNAEAEEFDLKNAIDENNEALNGQNQEMTGQKQENREQESRKQESQKLAGRELSSQKRRKRRLNCSTGSL